MRVPSTLLPLVVVTLQLLAPLAHAQGRPQAATGASPPGTSRLAEIRAAFASADSVARLRLFSEAARLGDPDAVRWLADVAATDAVLGAQAGAALGSVASREAVPELRRLMEAPEAPVIVRANAVRALGASGATGLGDALAAIVSAPEQPMRLRQEAALALAKSGATSAVGPLGSALDRLSSEVGPEAEQLRISIVEALAGLATPAARQVLQRHAGRSLPPAERAFTDRALRAQR